MGKQVIVPDFISDKMALFHEALLCSYSHAIQELDCKVSFQRRPSQIPFREVFEAVLNDKRAFWTIIFRKALLKHQVEHWEFSVNTNGDISHYIYICVRPDIAEEIFKKFNLIKES